MVSINIYLRLALIVAGILGGLALIFTLGFWYGFPFLLVGLFFLAGYIMLGTVQSAAQLVQAQQFDEAEKRLSLTRFPQWLYSANKAFYFILQGSFAMNKKQMDVAEDWFNKAHAMKLPSDNERAMVLLQLANINAQKQKWPTAQKFIADAKKLTITEPMIKEQLKEFDKAIQVNKGVMKNFQGAGSGMMFQPGGKRRRPKVR